ncbi:hypothetical protein DCC79_13665, partial [bacterium]
MKKMLQTRYRWLMAGGAALLTVVSLMQLGARPTSAQGAEEQLPALKGFDLGEFVENRGQWDEEVAFRSANGTGQAWFTPSRVMYMLLHFPNAPEAAPINGETGP